MGGNIFEKMLEDGILVGLKGLIAEFVAKAFEEYVEFDPDEIDARLLKSPFLVAENVPIKEIRINLDDEYCCIVNGEIGEIRLSWKWGRDPAHKFPWAKEVKLEFKKPQLIAQLSLGQTEERIPGLHREKEEQEDDDEEEDRERNGIEKYIEEQKNRLITTMMQIVATDVDIRIVLPLLEETPQIVMVGIPEVDLSHTSSQFRTISLRSLFAHFLIETNNQINVYPLIPPADHTVQLHGSSLDDITAVMVTSCEIGLTFNVGSVQLTCFNDFLGIILQVVLSRIENGLAGTASTETSKGGDDTESQEQPSPFMLQIATRVNFTMLSGTKVTNFSFLEVLLTIAFDGSIILLEGRGLLLDDQQIVSFSDHCSWCANIPVGYIGLQNEVEGLQKGGEDVDVLAFIMLQDFELLTLVRRIGELCKIYDDVRMVGAAAILEKIFAELDFCWVVDFEERVQLSFGAAQQLELAICGLRLKFGDAVSLLINSIDRMIMPGQFRLYKPIEYLAVIYDHDNLRIVVDSVEVILLGNGEMDEEASVRESPGEKANYAALVPLGRGNDIAVPAGLEVTIEEHEDTKDELEDTAEELEDSAEEFEDGPKELESSTEDLEDNSEDVVLSFPIDFKLSKLRVLTSDVSVPSGTLKDMHLCILPLSPDNSMVGMELTFKEVKHEMIKLEEPSLGAVFSLTNLDTISQANFKAERIYIATGYSAKNWLGLIGWRFGKQKKAKRSWKPITLPYVCVQPLKIIATIDGVVGLKETPIFMKKFEGRAETTTEDVIKFYSSSIVKNVPGFVTSTEVLGVDVTDTVVGQYGTAYAAHLFGGTAGGLAGGVCFVAAYDGIRNAIDAGKKSRGVESDDKWQFRDFSRGLKVVAKTAAKAGAEKRGKEGSSGNIVDWSYGMADDVGQYTSKNKSRLGAAGAATFGYAIGGVLGGPGGAIAGGIIASAVTGKTIDRYLKKKLDKEKWATLKEGCSLYEGTVEDAFGVQVKRIIGILTRRRKYFKRDWRPHLFILEKNELRYYETTGTVDPNDEDAIAQFDFDEDETPKKRLCLNGAQVAINDELSVESKGIFAFKIYGKDQAPWVLGAPTQEDRDLWVAKLVLVCQ